MTEPPAALGGAFAFVIGACFGSFVGSVAYRLPRNISIVRPRSFCPGCKQPIPARYNVPLLGYLLLRGRCQRCGDPIGARYLITESGLGLVALYLYLNFDSADALARFVLCAALWCIALIDLEYRIIPDVITLPGIVVGLIAGAYVISDVGALSAFMGMTAGAVILLAIALAYRLLKGKEGLGMGDVKLAAMAGAFLGWPGMLFTLLGGSLLGVMAGLFVVLGSRRSAVAMGAESEVTDDATGAAPNWLQTELPFGPFLGAAAMIYALFQPELMRWYLAP